MPKVSLIVAAYNIESYIKRCIKSLLNQTLKDIEIIIVNDGSTDNTLKVVEETCMEDNRIRVIDKRNEGVMKARKTGFEGATGEYILFVDGDDWLAESATEILYENAKQNDYDIVCFKFFYTNGKELEKSSQKHTEYKKLGGDEFLKMVMTSEILPALWIKLIKKRFIINNNVAFPVGIAKAEDLAFSCSLGMHFPKTCLIDEYLYYYFTIRSNSVTNTISPLLLEVGKATSFIRQQLKDNNIYDSYKEEFNYLAFTHNFNQDMIYIHRNKFSKLLYKEWKNMGIDIRKNKYYKNLIMKEPFKVRIISNMVVQHYVLSSIFYNLYKLFFLNIKRSNVV